MPRRLPSNYHPSLEELRVAIGDSVNSLELVRSRQWVSSSVRWLFVLFVLIVIGLACTPWQQTSSCSGKVVPYLPSERLQTINAPVKGVISHWDVVEGDSVEEGDSIAKISDIDPQLMERLGRQLDAARSAVEAAEFAVTTSRKNVERQQRLAEQGLKSQRDFELAQLEYQQLLSGLANKRNEYTQVEVKLARQSSQVIKAPRAGIIMRIFFPQGGAVVKAGDKIATLAPVTDQRVVELYVKGNDIPLVHKGRKVRLQFEGWPAVQFSGWPSVAVGTFGGLVKTIDPSDDGRGFFRILVEPDPDAAPWPSGYYLRQGVRVKGWVLMDTVSAGYELWRQFNSFPAEIKKPQKKDSNLARELSKQVGKLGK
jgi:biotin carboxyl carrier protein